MTPIQIITIKAKDKTIRTMIEKLSENSFRIYTSEKFNQDIYFSPFQEVNEEFSNAKLALEKSISYLNNETIIEVDNQISDLLTTEMIQSITKIDKVKES